VCVGLILILYNNGIYKGFKREKINKYVVIKLYIIVRTFMNNLKTLYYVNSTTIKKKKMNAEVVLILTMIILYYIK